MRIIWENIQKIYLSLIKANNLHTKKGDEFNLPKKYFKNIRAFIYGKNYEFFNKKLKDKI